MTIADRPVPPTDMTVPLIVLAPLLSAMSTLWFTVSVRGFGWVLNLGWSGRSVLDDLSFLIANWSWAAVRESLSEASTGVNQWGWRIVLPNQSLEGESCPLCWGVSRYMAHAFSKASMLVGDRSGSVMMHLRQRLRKILQEFSACPLDCWCFALDKRWTIPLLVIHLLRSPMDRFLSPSVARILGQVLA